MPGIPTDQVLAIIRLKQWAIDRDGLKNAKTCNYERKGWTQRNNRHADARIVRVIDFERAFNKLSMEDKTVLLLTYRESQGQTITAAAAECSVRKLAYLIPNARQHLADALDRLDLL
jgi:DNA-directed RNA polymerase specialized sigma24 family protein